MGYTTKFSGGLDFDRKVDAWLADYINAFADTRHMILNVGRIKSFFPDWKDMCFKGKLGKHGQYFTGIRDFDHKNPSMCIVNPNKIPQGCPGLYCKWIIKDNRLVWDGSEKFYDYTDWIYYLIENFFEPEGYVLNGKIQWHGEDMGDCGVIQVADNKVTVRKFE